MKRANRGWYLVSLLAFFLGIFTLVSCDSPPTENIYRKEGRFSSAVNAPVAFLSSEWAGKPRVMASGWLIDGGNGVLFSAKHFTDVFMGNVIELGSGECKAFMAGRVYSCMVVRLPPLRDAVVLKLQGNYMADSLPKPFKIATTKVKIGETLFIHGMHPHPREITESNKEDSVIDLLMPIMKDFYEVRTAEPEKQSEVSYDVLKSRVVSVNERIRINDQEGDPLEEVRYESNEYIKVITEKNHKFSFGGLSGGVVTRLNSNGEHEAVGIVTAEQPVRFEYDKKGLLVNKKEMVAVFDTILVTPIYSVEDLIEYARMVR